MKALTGKTIPLSVDLCCTIEDLKEMIQDAEGVPRCCMHSCTARRWYAFCC